MIASGITIDTSTKSLGFAAAGFVLDDFGAAAFVVIDFAAADFVVVGFAVSACAAEAIITSKSARFTRRA
jgi:hypothetical protein